MVKKNSILPTERERKDILREIYSQELINQKKRSYKKELDKAYNEEVLVDVCPHCGKLAEFHREKVIGKEQRYWISHCPLCKKKVAVTFSAFEAGDIATGTYIDTMPIFHRVI